MARETQHRKQIMDILARGPVEDPGGLAVQTLQAETGHDTTNALSKVLRQMEAHGLIRREVKGRRTFRIWRPDVAETLAPAATAPTAPYIEDEERPGEVDYEILAGVLLKTALRAMQADDHRAELTTLRRTLLTTEGRAHAAEGERDELRQRLAEAEEQARIATQNQQLLLAQLDKAKHRRGVPVAELISEAERRELAKLAREVPSRRG